MTLDQLVTFHKVCTMKSFRRAADALHLSQPAVSKQIAALEAELGEQLFERGRTAVITESGKTLLKYAEHVSSTLQNARSEIADIRELKRGHLVIGASHTLATNLLPDLVEKFRLKYPQITMSVETGWAPEIVSRVQSHDLDLGLAVLVGSKSDNPQLVYQAFDISETVFITSGKEPLVTKAQISFDEFAKLPLILNHQGCLYRRYLEGRFAEHSTAINVAVEVLGFELEKKLTQLGLGVSLLSRAVVNKELKEGSLKTFKVKGLDLRSYSCLVYRREKYFNGAMRGFLKILQEIFPKCNFSHK